MPLEFESEEAFQASIANYIHPEEIGEMEQVGSTGAPSPLEFGSEESFQQASMMPQEQAMMPQQEMPQSPQGVNPSDLASAVLGRAMPQPQQPKQISRKSIIENYGPRGNTLAAKLPAGLEEFHPADMEAVTQTLSASFMSMSSTGILLDPMERVMYATSVMENTTVRADIRAQLIDQAMRDGKVLPQALPKSWYEARGLLLLPPDLNLDNIEGEIV